MPISAFGTQGATPNAASSPTYNPYTGSTSSTPTMGTPVSRALSAPPAVPTTPVKKTTQNNVDGSSTVTEYHPPATSSGSTTASPTTSGMLPQAPATSQTNTTFPGLVSGLANTANAGSSTAPGYIQSTADYGAGNIPLGQDAQNIANNYGQQIANVGQKGAQFGSGQLTTGTSPVAEGNAAVTAQTTAAQQQALATGENAALLGNQQALTAQDQAATASNAAAGQSNTAQGLVQSGLGAAGSLVQPSATAAGQTVFNPATGSFTGNSLGNSTTAPSGYTQDGWNQIVSNVANGNTGAISGLSPALQAQAQADAAAQNPGFNINAAQGQAAGQQALAEAPLQGQATGTAAAAAAPGQATATNTTTAGTAATQGAAASLQSAGNTYNNMLGFNKTAELQAQNVQSVLQSTGLNSGAPAFNKPLNSLTGQLGSSKVTSLTTAVTEMQSAYSQLLTSGGTQTPSSSEQQALSILNPNSTPAQIKAAITQLQDAAYAKLTGQYSQVQTAQQAMKSSGAPSYTNGTSVSTSVGNLVYQDGKWVVQ